MKANLALALVGAALISLPAAAQMTTPTDSETKTTTQSSASAAPMYEMKAGQWRATRLAGVAVYNNSNEKIGDVNELILGRDGKVEAVVIGVGGFLGMGEHLAAVPFDKIRWVDTPRETTTSTRTTTTTSGSGASTAPADSPSAGNATERTTTTTTAERPASATTPTANTTGTNTARDAYRGYPDHAMLDMTKEQLKALPVVRYAR